MLANSSEERHDKNQDSKIIKGSQIFKEDPEDDINEIQDNSNQNIANKLKYYQIKVNENKFNINSRHKVAKKGINAEIPVKKINILLYENPSNNTNTINENPINNDNNIVILNKNPIHDINAILQESPVNNILNANPNNLNNIVNNNDNYLLNYDQVQYNNIFSNNNGINNNKNNMNYIINNNQANKSKYKINNICFDNTNTNNMKNENKFDFNNKFNNGNNILLNNDTNNANYINRININGYPKEFINNYNNSVQNMNRSNIRYISNNNNIDTQDINRYNNNTNTLDEKFNKLIDKIGESNMITASLIKEIKVSNTNITTLVGQNQKILDMLLSEKKPKNEK
jgi:hypothetical protein